MIDSTGYISLKIGLLSKGDAKNIIALLFTYIVLSSPQAVAFKSAYWITLAVIAASIVINDYFCELKQIKKEFISSEISSSTRKSREEFAKVMLIIGLVGAVANLASAFLPPCTGIISGLAEFSVNMLGLSASGIAIAYSGFNKIRRYQKRIYWFYNIFKRY